MLRGKEEVRAAQTLPRAAFHCTPYFSVLDFTPVSRARQNQSLILPGASHEGAVRATRTEFQQLRAGTSSPQAICRCDGRCAGAGESLRKVIAIALAYFTLIEAVACDRECLCRVHQSNRSMAFIPSLGLSACTRSNGC